MAATRRKHQKRDSVAAPDIQKMGRAIEQAPHGIQIAATYGINELGEGRR
jgi:hypothetical protein